MVRVFTILESVLLVADLNAKGAEVRKVRKGRKTAKTPRSREGPQREKNRKDTNVSRDRCRARKDQKTLHSPLSTFRFSLFTFPFLNFFPHNRKKPLYRIAHAQREQTNQQLIEKQ